jgi:engulfment and cell motility protein 1
MFALRDEHDQLVTDDNLRRNIRERTPLKFVYEHGALSPFVPFLTCSSTRLVNSPAADALEAVNKLAGKHDNSLRLTLFSLQKFIRVRSSSCASQPYAH